MSAVSWTCRACGESVRAIHDATKLCRDCQRATKTDDHVANLRRYVDDARGWSNASDSRTMYFSELRGVVGALDAITKERDELRAAARALVDAVDSAMAECKRGDDLEPYIEAAAAALDALASLLPDGGAR